MQDVWAFGITLYEIFADAATPYGDEWTNRDVYERVEQGYRLPPPKKCPKCCYDLVRESGIAPPSAALEL